ncbi:MAG: acyltransferase family protein [Actinomycetota bacterium]
MARHPPVAENRDVATKGVPVEQAVGRTKREPYLDLLRAGSLFVVVAWHWVFSVVWWGADGPHTGNPIATTPGGWALTWVLQVMPVFFFVGGYVHLRTWESVELAGGGWRTFVSRRLKRLLVPALVCLGAAGALRLFLAVVAPGLTWASQGLFVVLTPLWFLAIYVGQVLIAPAAARAHGRFGVRVPVALAAGAAAVDVARFAFGIDGVQWANLLLVWAFTHQLGFFWPLLAAAGRGVAGALALAGLAGLAVLTNIGVYSRSMVGVAGEAVSNMGPPTACILALTLLQTGLILLLREPAERWLERPRPRRLVQWAGARAMTVYLWHFPAFAVAYGLVRLAGIEVPDRPSAAWWLQRPLWVLLPALCILPFVGAFRRFDRRRAAAPAIRAGRPGPQGR